MYFLFSRAEMFNNHNIHLTSNGYLPLIRLVFARNHLKEFLFHIRKYGRLFVKRI